MTDIWSECNGEEHITSINGVLYRLVESQEQVATIGYVDTLEEQSVLEDLLDGSKPDYPDEVNGELHYLLKTPFRYPPLPWGSRFGRAYEPSLFYGGKSIEATLAESAFYRFVFLQSMEGLPPYDKLRTEHTMFSVGYQTHQGIRLQLDPFNKFRSNLVDPTDYSNTQVMGTKMREVGIEVFEYVSARSRESALCAAILTPAAFSEKAPQSIESWFCEMTKDKVTFKALSTPELHNYALEYFQVDGAFPFPA